VYDMDNLRVGLGDANLLINGDYGILDPGEA
jgi:hypothetical protein